MRVLLVLPVVKIVSLALTLVLGVSGLAWAEPASVALSDEQPLSTTGLSPDDVVSVQPIELRASAIKTNHFAVDLATVLKLVEDQNLLIAQFKKSTELQENRLRQQAVALLPNINASFSRNGQSGQQRFISGAQGGFISGGTTGSSTTASTGSSSSTARSGSSTTGGTQYFVQAQLGASWTIYPGGRNVYQILAAKRRKNSADSLLQGTYQEQLALAAQDYYKLLAAYQQKGVMVRSIANVLEQVRFQQSKVKVGKGIPLDLSQAKTNYAQQQSSLIQSESAILQAEQALLNRLNLEPTIHLIPAEADAAQKPLVTETIPLEQLVIRAVKQNPAIQSGDEELKALGYDYKTTRSDLIPAVTLQAYVRGSGTEMANMQRSNSSGLSINANLLESFGLAVPLRMQEKKQLIQQKMLAQQGLVRDVQSKVMTAFLSSENYGSAIEAASQALRSAEDTYSLSMGRFQAGYGVYLDVLTAQTQLTTARSNLVQAVLNYNQAQVQLVQALGMVTPAALLQGIEWQGANAHGKS